MKRVLLTGGSGFIGTNLHIHLKKNGFKVLSIDIKKPKIKKLLNDFKKISILEKDSLKKIIDEFKPEIIINAAARTDLNGKSLSDYSENFQGLENLLQASTSKRVELFIHFSSMLVCKLGYLPKHDTDYCPDSYYGQSKVLSEQVFSKYDLGSTTKKIVRPTSIWGMWMGEPYIKFFDAIYAKRFFLIKGKETNRTFGYVGNLLGQISSLIANFDQGRDCYYLGDLKATNIKDWAFLVSEKMKKGKINSLPPFVFFCSAVFGSFLSLLHIPFPMNLRRYRNMTTDYVIPQEWIPKSEITYPLDEAIEETLEWYLETK